MSVLLQATSVLALLSAVTALPLSSSASQHDKTNPSCDVSDPSCGPIPGESSIYNNYTGVAAPFPGNITAPINATEPNAAPGPDDELFRNLLSAEWIIYSFYQTAVETFNKTSFTDLGLPANTYERVTQIRDNEAGHLRIFQDSISPASLKPGPCKYDYGFGKGSSSGEALSSSSAAKLFLALQQLLEQASESFLTGLVMQAKTNETRGALVAIGEIEARHSAWALIDVWNVNPFTGPAETIFPYANEILATTNGFVVPGSCPPENPQYPYPSQNLPTLSFDRNTTDAKPGSKITLEYDAVLDDCKDYHAVFFHGVRNITMPLDMSTNSTTIPAEIEDTGIILVVVADKPGAPTIDSVVAGPLFIVQQPGNITLSLP